MQLSLNFDQTAPVASTLTHLHQRLLSAFGPFPSDRRQEALDQRVRSRIGSPAHDEDSQFPYEHLKSPYPDGSALAEAFCAHGRA